MQRMRLFVLTIAALLLLQAASHAQGVDTPYGSMSPYSYESRFSNFSGYYQGGIRNSGGSSPDSPKAEKDGNLAFIISPGSPKMYWKAMTFDVFDGRRWYRSGYASLRPAPVSQAPAGTEWLSFQAYKEIIAPGNYYLVYPSTPFSMIGENGTVASAPRDAYGDYQFYAPSAGNITYNISYASIPSELGNAGALGLAWMGNSTFSLVGKEREIDLSLYSGFPESAANLSALLKLQGASPFEQARHDANYIRVNFGYSLKWAGKSEVLAQPDLLSMVIEKRSGFCIHYASLLAMVLRHQGVPSRIATGYAGGMQFEGKSHLTSDYLHAWTEVFQDGVGWMPVDATPSGGGQGAAEGSPDSTKSPSACDIEQNNTWTRNGVVNPELRSTLDRQAESSMSNKSSGTTNKSAQGVGGQEGPYQPPGGLGDSGKTKLDNETGACEQGQKGMDGQNETPFMNDSINASGAGKGGFQPFPDNPLHGNGTPAGDPGGTGPRGAGNASSLASNPGMNESSKEWDSLMKRFDEQAKYARDMPPANDSEQGALADSDDLSGKLGENKTEGDGKAPKSNLSSDLLNGTLGWKGDGSLNSSQAGNSSAENMSAGGRQTPGAKNASAAAGASENLAHQQTNPSYDLAKVEQNLLAIAGAACVAALIAAIYAISKSVPHLRANYSSLKREEERKKAVVKAREIFKSIDLNALILEVEDLGSSGRHREAVLCAYRGFEDYLAFASRMFNYPHLTAREYSSLLRSLPFHSHLEIVVSAFELARYTDGRIYEGQYARVLASLKQMRKLQASKSGQATGAG